MPAFGYQNHIPINSEHGLIRVMVSGHMHLTPFACFIGHWVLCHRALWRDPLHLIERQRLRHRHAVPSMHESN